jgi:hypothetical protein
MRVTQEAAIALICAANMAISMTAEWSALSKTKFSRRLA